MDVSFQDREGNEIQVDTIKVSSGTKLIVKILPNAPANVKLKIVAESVERGLEAGSLIVPDWVELKFVEIE